LRHRSNSTMVAVVTKHSTIIIRESKERRPLTSEVAVPKTPWEDLLDLDLVVLTESDCLLSNCDSFIFIYTLLSKNY
jgi:hypothetical protein